MIETPDIIEIELSAPYRVQGEAARGQSVWLLARLWHAYHFGDGSVSAAALRLGFPGQNNIRMLISRAFADFARWGVQAGWGAAHGQPISTLPLNGRSRGPFWLTADMASRLRFSAGGVEVERDWLEHFLGLRRERPGNPAGDLPYLMRDMRFWQQMAQAIRDEYDGFGRRPSRQVAESFHVARQFADDDFQQALALMKESLAWRRSAQLDGSRSALKRLDRVLDAGSVHHAHPTFAAMACIVRAWERYTHGDAEAAQTMLEHLQTSPELQPVFRYNPRVRFECLNLMALLHKHAATSGAGIARQQARPGRRGSASAERRAGGGLRGGFDRRRPTCGRQYRLVLVAVLAARFDRPGTKTAGERGATASNALAWPIRMDLRPFRLRQRLRLEPDLHPAHRTRQLSAAALAQLGRFPRTTAAGAGNRHRRPASLARLLVPGQGL
ncbi:hypothetical protein JOS77_01840 [Chromobacterium haemolyticum]|nr:hypothetical protein JOS77_01840 [Chromobacterium haemolyticum]